MSLFSKLRGTIETLFQVGLGGPQWKNNGGVLEATNPTNSGLVVGRGADPVAANDWVTLEYLQARIGTTITGTTNVTSPVTLGTVNFTAPGAMTVEARYTSQDTTTPANDSGGIRLATFRYDGTTVTQVGATSDVGTPNGTSTLNIAPGAGPAISIAGHANAADLTDWTVKISTTITP